MSPVLVFMCEHRQEDLPTWHQPLRVRSGFLTSLKSHCILSKPCSGSVHSCNLSNDNDPTNVRALSLFIFPLERRHILLLILEAKTPGTVGSPSSSYGPLQLDGVLSGCPSPPST